MSKTSRKSAATKSALREMCEQDTPPKFSSLGLQNTSNPAVSKKKVKQYKFRYKG